MLSALIVAMLAYGQFLAPTTGRYTVTSDGTSIVRMDTASGEMQTCHVVGSAVSCDKPVALSSTR